MLTAAVGCTRPALSFPPIPGWPASFGHRSTMCAYGSRLLCVAATSIWYAAIDEGSTTHSVLHDVKHSWCCDAAVGTGWVRSGGVHRRRVGSGGSSLWWLAGGRWWCSEGAQCGGWLNAVLVRSATFEMCATIGGRLAAIRAVSRWGDV